MSTLRRRDQAWNPPSQGIDISGLLALILALAFLLPVAIDFADLAFAVPALLLPWAAARCWSLVRGGSCPRVAWAALTVGAAAGAAASAVAVASMLAGVEATGAFYVGFVASLGLLVGLAAMARDSLSKARPERIVDALLVAAVFTAGGVYFVVVPGFSRGDALLTLVFLVDLAAVALAALSVLARTGRRHRRIGWRLLLLCAAAAGGDAVVSASAAGQLPSLTALTALMWTVAGWALLSAARVARDEEAGGASAADDQLGARWVVARIVLPLLAVLLFPALALTLWAAGELPGWGAGYFAAWFILALTFAFGRQAYLLVDNQRAAIRDRRLREEAVRRNEELEALTSLATTMTQTLEEAPIVERGLEVLALAARATSSALHLHGEGAPSLAATTGRWHSEHPWADRAGSASSAVEVQSRGKRQVVRLQVAARGHEIGVVTLIRAPGDHLDEEELGLLRLLVDQLAIALQNARDYREKLEQATRDPLTGLYNRRFFYEALDKEVARHERHGSTASLVLFDIDDFKLVNDTHGHACGDDVLRGIARTVHPLIRPGDTFARIGGEELGLLLPETGQLDALLIAERIRTAIGQRKMVPGGRVTISGGVSSLPQDATTRQELERKADGALYWAKRSGKNMCAVASEVTESIAERGGGDSVSHLYGLVAAIDEQEFLTRDHSENVAAYAVAVGQGLGMDAERIVRLRRAALLHDVGKVAVKASTLTKPSELDEAEMAEIRLHPTVGARMVRHAGLSEEASWVRHHHERVDGRGYPDGLAGDAIPLEARIIFVADSFEAMTSDRPYRTGMPIEDALEELRRHRGTQFDARVVDALMRLVGSGDLNVLALRR